VWPAAPSVAAVCSLPSVAAACSQPLVAAILLLPRWRLFDLRKSAIRTIPSSARSVPWIARGTLGYKIGNNRDKMGESEAEFGIAIPVRNGPDCS
jgi:hypothetical protein